MLTAVATEDLSRVRNLAVLPLIAAPAGLEPPLKAALPLAAVEILPPAGTIKSSKAALGRFFRR
jgi:hypothetical protein